jgi:tRNA-dihydrouridine synthase B
LPPPTPGELRERLLAHLGEHYAFHGEYTGVRTARKHVSWYLAAIPGWQALRARFNSLERPEEQRDLVADFLAGSGAAPAAPGRDPDPAHRADPAPLEMA